MGKLYRLDVGRSTCTPFDRPALRALQSGHHMAHKDGAAGHPAPTRRARTLIWVKLAYVLRQRGKRNFALV
ncbi:hypothetical protein GCM10027597_38420 [Saccharopolyspora tripterygii]